MKWAEGQCPKVVISFLLVSSLHSAPYKVPYSEYGIVNEWVISGTALATPPDPAQLFKLCASLLSFVLLLLSCNKDERWQRSRDETFWREDTDGRKKKKEKTATDQLNDNDAVHLKHSVVGYHHCEWSFGGSVCRYCRGTILQLKQHGNWSQFRKCHVCVFVRSVQTGSQIL